MLEKNKIYQSLASYLIFEQRAFIWLEKDSIKELKEGNWHEWMNYSGL